MKLKLMDSIKDSESNVIDFAEISSCPESYTFKTLGKFYHWFYFPEIDKFAPSKFIGYKNTKVETYQGDGTGSDTTTVLKKWFF